MNVFISLPAKLILINRMEKSEEREREGERERKGKERLSRTAERESSILLQLENLMTSSHMTDPPGSINIQSKSYFIIIEQFS